MLGKQNLFARRTDPGLRDPRQVSHAAANAPLALNPIPASPPPAASGVAARPAQEPAPAPSAPGSENRLIVGPDVKLKGAEILDCDTLIVEGRVEATIDSRVIRIAEQGAFCGKVGIDIAEIRGSFEGELVARGQLVIHATGRVSGKIRYGRILIEEGGEVSGDVRSLAEDGKGIVVARPVTLSSIAAAEAPLPKALATMG